MMVRQHTREGGDEPFDRTDCQPHRLCEPLAASGLHKAVRVRLICSQKFKVEWTSSFDQK